MNARFLAFTFVIFTFGSLLAITPYVQAQVTGGWTREIIPSTTGVIDEMQGDNNGESIGIAYRYSSSGKIGFSYSATPTVDSSWAEMNGDVTVGNANGPHVAKVLWVNANTWLLAVVYQGGSNTNAEKVYRTTDNGATWTATFTHNTPTPPTDSLGTDLARASATKIGYMTNVEASGQGPDYVESNDGGATWNLFASGNSETLGDNSGADGSAGSNNNGNGGGAVIGYHAGVFEVFYMHNTVPNQGYHSVAGSGATWTVSYGNPTCYNDLGGTVCWVAQATGAFSHAAAALVTGNLYTTRVFSSAGLTNGYAGGLTSLTLSSNIAPVPANQGSGSFTNIGTCASGTWQTGRTHTAIDANSNDVFVIAWTCGANGLVVKYMQPTTSTPWTTSLTSAGINSNDVETIMTTSKSFVFYTNSTFGSRFELVWTNSPTAASQPVVSRTITNAFYEGADVDPFKSVLIERILSTSPSNAEVIYSLDATNLQNRAGPTPLANGCTFQDDGVTWRNGGVMAYHDNSQNPNTGGKDFTAFLDCTGTDKKNANIWKIRGGGLDAPDQSGTVCVDGDFCGTDISTTASACNGGNNDLPNRAQEIQDVQAVPIAWTTASTSGINHATVGFAYNDHSNGNVGVWVIMQRNNSEDVECQASLPFSNPGETQQICSWRNANTQDGSGNLVPGDGSDYLTAVGQNAASKVWKVLYSETSNGFATGPQIQLSQVLILSSPWDKALAIGCAGPDVLLERASDHHINRIHAVSGALGSPMWANDVVPSASVIRGISMSQNGLVYAYVDGANIQIGNAITGNNYGFVPYTTGASVEWMELSDTGTTLYTVEQSGVDVVTERFDIQSLTGAIPDGTRQALNGTSTVCVGSSLSVASCTSGNTTTGTGGAGCDGSPSCGAPDSGPGTHCTDHYEGKVKVGVTYVPILFLDWSNCAAMVTETILTILVLIAIPIVVRVKRDSHNNDETGGTTKKLPLGSVGILTGVGYLGSNYLWQAPKWPWLILFVGLLALLFMNLRRSNNTQEV